MKTAEEGTALLASKVTMSKQKPVKEEANSRLASTVVDVIVLTRNSERLLGQCFRSIYENVPVNRLIVVDGFSTDATVDIVKKFQRRYGNVFLIQEGGTRGSARERAMREVKTDWFMFVDSDVVLCDGWFAEAAKLIRGNVGAIWGMEVWSVLRNMRILKLFERVTMKIFEKRGGTHDLLVRRKAVEGIHIPSHLHTYEDSYIKSWISKNGYEAIPVYKPYCIHYRPEIVWTFKESFGLIASDFKFAVRYPQLLLSYSFYAAIVLYQSVSHGVKAIQLKFRQ